MNRRLLCAFLVAFLLLATAGCGQPRVAPENLELTVKLRTALSAHNREWLAQVESLASERRMAGEMAEEEYAAFQKIIALARDDQWSDAERACLKLQRGQRPEPAQREHMERMQALSRP